MDNTSISNTPPDSKSKSLPRVLCLHGWRTSAKILSMQMASLRYHVHADFVFLDGTYPAEGPADSLVERFYPNQPYYEWTVNPKSEETGIDESCDSIIAFMKINGPFHGILGFSQGASMATRIVSRLRNTDMKLHFAILIGAICPTDREKMVLSEHISDSRVDGLLEIPSLHIIGNADFLKSRSEQLFREWYARALSQSLYHEEGHNIPSMRTGLYPMIDAWIEEVFSSSQVITG